MSIWLFCKICITRRDISLWRLLAMILQGLPNPIRNLIGTHLIDLLLLFFLLLLFRRRCSWTCFLCIITRYTKLFFEIFFQEALWSWSLKVRRLWDTWNYRCRWLSHRFYSRQILCFNICCIWGCQQFLLICRNFDFFLVILWFIYFDLLLLLASLIAQILGLLLRRSYHPSRRRWLTLWRLLGSYWRANFVVSLAIFLFLLLNNIQKLICLTIANRQFHLPDLYLLLLDNSL